MAPTPENAPCWQVRVRPREICGHTVPVTLCAAHRALTRVVAHTHYVVGPNWWCIAFLMPHLPAPKPCVAFLIWRWLQRCACWDG